MYGISNLFDNQQGNSLKEGKQESHVCYPNPITYSTYYAYWDGKIGIWPKGSYQPAVRGSVNCNILLLLVVIATMVVLGKQMGENNADWQ